MPPMKGQPFPKVIDGGWSTERGPSAGFPIDQAGMVHVPFLVDAENLVYTADGWVRKMPGASRVNTVTTGATDAVMGIFDYIRSGTGVSTVQKRVIYAGTAIYKDDADGVWDSLKTGLEANRMPWFEVMNDILVMATDSTVDVPQAYDQTTIADLGGSPPNFAFHVEHRGRMWASGVAANKSRLYYSALDNPQDWTGAGSGSIDIAPDDGDQITGIWSHKSELLVFKGPNRLSIHRITGSAPTGADAFARIPFISRGVGAYNQHSIVPVRDDLVFPSPAGVHSLLATAAFGDYNVTFVSADIADYYLSQLNHSRMDRVWGVNFAVRGYALWTVSRSGSSTNDAVLLWDTRFSPARWALWSAYDLAALAMVKDTAGLRVPWGGTYTGFVLRMDRADRNLEGGAYTGKLTFPYLSYGDEFFTKTLTQGRIALTPKGSSTLTFGYTRDRQTQQTVSVSQAGGATLGAFTLDTDVLSGGDYTQAFFDLEGAFKQVQFQLTQGGVNEDMEPHGLSIMAEDAGFAMAVPEG